MNMNLIARKNLCEQLRVGVRTLQNWEKKGLKQYKVGKSVYYDLQEVEDFVKGKKEGE